MFAEHVSDDLLQAYAEAARKYDIVIAELGAWRGNPLHPDPRQRAIGRDYLKTKQRQADEPSARSPPKRPPSCL